MLGFLRADATCHFLSMLQKWWTKIASHLPRRTDNEIKNHWNTYIKKKLKKMGIDPVTHKSQPTSSSEIDQNKETETSMQSTITVAKEEDKTVGSPFDFMEVNNGFYTDEVLLIQLRYDKSSIFRNM